MFPLWVLKLRQIKTDFSILMLSEWLLTPMTITYVPKNWISIGHFFNRSTISWTLNVKWRHLASKRTHWTIIAATRWQTPFDYVSGICSNSRVGVAIDTCLSAVGPSMSRQGSPTFQRILHVIQSTEKYHKVVTLTHSVLIALSPFVPVDPEFLASHWPMTGVCTWHTPRTRCISLLRGVCQCVDRHLGCLRGPLASLDTSNKVDYL